MSHMVKIIKNIKNPREVKIVSNKGKKETINCYHQGNWKGHNNIYGVLYPVICNDTAYIPYLGLNIFSVMCAITKGFIVTSR